MRCLESQGCLVSTQPTTWVSILLQVLYTVHGVTILVREWDVLAYSVSHQVVKVRPIKMTMSLIFKKMEQIYTES